MRNFTNQDLTQMKTSIKIMKAPYVVKQVLTEYINKEQARRDRELKTTHNLAMSLLKVKPKSKKIRKYR